MTTGTWYAVHGHGRMHPVDYEPNSAVCACGPFLTEDSCREWIQREEGRYTRHRRRRVAVWFVVGMALSVWFFGGLVMGVWG